MSDNPKENVELTETRSNGALQSGIPLDNNAEEASEAPDNYIKGLRLHLITAAYEPLVIYSTPLLIGQSRLCMCLFLTNMESTIVVTALIGITNDLGGFQLSSWIIAAYLLGYVGKYKTSYAKATTD